MVSSQHSVTVAWNVCCQSRKFGGLGVKDLNLFNKALLSKLTWKVMTSSSSNFSFFQSKYVGKKGNFVASLIWPAMCDLLGFIFSSCLRLIGTNSQVNFWLDNWLGRPLKDVLNL